MTYQSDVILDLKGVPCPRNTAMAIIQLETMDQDEILKIIVDDGEPIKNVPPSLEEDDEYEIIARKKSDQGCWHLYVKVL